MELHGKNIIAESTSAEGGTRLRAVNPANGKELEPSFAEATTSEVDRAVRAADEAGGACRKAGPERIARFLEAIGEEIVALGESLIQRCKDETGLPEARLTAERGRTVGQLAMFAALVREGSWVDARMDRPLPDRKPIPKPDVRRMLAPMGPVAIFGASNFPLAFSVAGGDTASALAAGNPVVVKAHPSHPGTSEMVLRAMQKAARNCDLPAGVASMVHGASVEVGLALVKHPLIRAVGFTGSLGGGRALCDAAAARPEPIPVYAEMGSTNPVYVLPGALKERASGIAEGLAGSVTLGVGQFCTNPGLVFGLAGPDFDAFVAEAAKRLAAVPAGTMLNAGICARYCESVSRVRGLPGVRVAGEAAVDEGGSRAAGSAALFVTDGATFAETPALREELFGPSTVLVACASQEELVKIAGQLPGQLTATVHGTPADLEAHRELLGVLAQRVGRLICNGFPTGVEVCAAMHHGGPYPATSNGLYTSVGTAAILRFARPICYQSFPQELLPPELRDKNERGIWRLVDGERTRDDV
jgi:NADP-dependent aldehyde dehydrogenase